MINVLTMYCITKVQCSSWYIAMFFTVRCNGPYSNLQCSSPNITLHIKFNVYYCRKVNCSVQCHLQQTTTAAPKSVLSHPMLLHSRISNKEISSAKQKQIIFFEKRLRIYLYLDYFIVYNANK